MSLNNDNPPTGALAGALAKRADEPLLFAGNDFVQTGSEAASHG
ncbi:type II toxin-antitoxin system VapC family toxin [Arvimicrobium flavum]|nr:type II toxin-antitoxin system VapC family toxin [Mesorhizobium shangrilense]